MDLTPYLDSLRRDLAASAAPAGEAVASSAELLASALEAATRLCLIEALSDAAAEITTKLDGPTVEVRMRGRDADLVVSDITPAVAVPPPPVTEAGGDVARITLRLPEVLKEQAERAAAEEGISVNAWLVRAVAAALQGGGGWPGWGGWPGGFGPGGPGGSGLADPGARPGGPAGPATGGFGAGPGGMGPGPGGTGAGGTGAGGSGGGRGRRPRRVTGWAQA